MTNEVNLSSPDRILEKGSSYNCVTISDTFSCTITGEWDGNWVKVQMSDGHLTWINIEQLVWFKKG